MYLAKHVKTVDESICSVIFIPFKSDIMFARLPNFANILQHPEDAKTSPPVSISQRVFSHHYSPSYPPDCSVQIRLLVALVLFRAECSEQL